MFFVTGATGNVGHQVARQLLRQGHRVRVFARDPRKAAAQLAGAGGPLEIFEGDWRRAETFAPALAGIQAAFVMNRGLELEPLRAFLAAAKAAACTYIVYLSSLAAADDSLAIGRLHREHEDAITASGIPAAYLRPGGFMSNAYQWIPMIHISGLIPNPLGDAAYAPIAPEDIAAVAVHLLTAPAPMAAVYPLTGGEHITLPDQVAILAEIVQRPLQAQEISTAQAIAGMIEAGLPLAVAEAIAESLVAVRRAGPAPLSDTVQQLLRRPPQTFREWAQQHAGRFRSPTAARP